MRLGWDQVFLCVIVSCAAARRGEKMRKKMKNGEKWKACTQTDIFWKIPVRQTTGSLAKPITWIELHFNRTSKSCSPVIMVQPWLPVIFTLYLRKNIFNIHRYQAIMSYSAVSVVFSIILEYCFWIKALLHDAILSNLSRNAGFKAC